MKQERKKLRQAEVSIPLQVVPIHPENLKTEKTDIGSSQF